MGTKFKVRDKEYELSLEERERGEGDKFHPFTATVTGQSEGPVTGTLQFTPEAYESAGGKAGGAPDVEALGRAGGRALAAEILIRRLNPDFSFIVDHRWLS